MRPKSPSKPIAEPHARPRGTRRLAAALALAFAAGCGELETENALPDEAFSTAPAPVLWSAGLESYGIFTILKPAQHAASLVRDKFLGWDRTSVRLTVTPSPTLLGFAPGKALVVDGLIPGASSYPPLAFGAFDGSKVPPLGNGNGSDVLVLSFDAWFATFGSTVSAFADLTSTPTVTRRQVPSLTIPSRQLLRVTVVANRSQQTIWLPDLDDDGEISSAETLAPDHMTAYYRLPNGTYGLAHPGQPAAALDPAAFTSIRWHITQGLVSGALYDDFLLAHDPRTRVNGVPVLELMPAGKQPPVDPQDPADQAGEVALELLDDDLELFEPVLDPAESRSLREQFNWSTTSAWPEGPEATPALFYSMLYVTDPGQRAALDEAGVHWDALPLFSEEMRSYDGRVGVFEHEPDDIGGHWVYALLPGSVFNVIREEALTGNVVFDAVIQRPIPEVDAKNPDGSLSYHWLGSQGGLYAAAVQEDAPNAAPAPIFKPDYDEAEEAEQAAVAAGGEQPQMTPRRFGRRLRKAFKKVVDKGKDVVNKVREGVSNVVELVAPEVDLDFEVTVLNSDSGFDRNAPMARGWGPEIGRALSLPGTELRVRQGKVLLNRAKVNKHGKASVTVIKKLKTDVCIVMSNHAAELTTFLIETRICDFSGSNLGRVKGDRKIHFKVRHGFSSVLAQMTDAYEYMERIEGKKMHRASVLVGRFADLFSSGASYAPCFDFFNMRLRAEGVATDVGVITLDGALAALGVPPVASALVWAAEFMTGVDIVIRDESENSRGVPTHEYGHFAMCSLMYTKSLRLFSNVNADIIHKTVGGGRDAGHDVLAINEGFADYVTTQVVGGFNYWEGASGTGIWTKGVFYCDPDSQSCADDNVGGTLGGEQTTPNTGKLSEVLNFKAAQVMTYLVDVADGHTGGGDRPGNGAAFDHNGTHLVPDTGGTLTRNDEQVALGQGWLSSFVAKLHNRRVAGGVSWRLDRKEFFKALNDLVVANSSRRQACDLCELHLDNQFCDAAGYSTFACTTHVLTAQVLGTGTVTSSNAGRVSPAPMSCTATGGVCSASFDTGTTVTLQATPGTGQAFVGWTGACAGLSTSCTVHMDRARSVAAIFQGVPVKVTLTVALSAGSGSSGLLTSAPAGINCHTSGSPGTCSMQLDVGTHVTLDGTIHDAHFLSFGQNTVCASAGDDFTCTFDIVSNTHVTGTFWRLL